MISEQVITRGYPYLETSHLLAVMDSMMECYNFTTSVNNHPRLQREMSHMTDSVLPDLINIQEQESMCCYLRCLFQLNAETEKDIENRHKIAEERLTSTWSLVVKSYMDCLRKISFLTHRTRETDHVPPPTKEELWLKKLTQSKIPVILLILNQFSQFRDKQLSTNLSLIYPLLCDLTLSDSFLVRKSLRDALIRIGKIKIGEFHYEVVDVDTSSLDNGLVNHNNNHHDHPDIGDEGDEVEKTPNHRNCSPEIEVKDDGLDDDKQQEQNKNEPDDKHQNKIEQNPKLEDVELKAVPVHDVDGGMM